METPATYEQFNLTAFASILRKGRAVSEYVARYHENQGNDLAATIRAQKSAMGQLAQLYASLDSRGGHYVAYKNSKRMIAEKMESGRAYAIGCSSQGIARPIRQAIVAGYAVDLDMKKAHPTILLHLARVHYGCEKMPAMYDFVRGNAEFTAKVIEQCGGEVTEDWVKVQVLAMVNGGSLSEMRAQSANLRKIHEEMREFALEMAPKLEHLREVCEQTTAQAYAPVENRMLIQEVATYERQILNVAVKHLASIGISAACLIFDGAHFACTPDTQDATRARIIEEIPAVEAAVVTAGLPPVTFAVKPFEHAVDWQSLPDDTVETSWTPQIFSAKPIADFTTSTWTFEDVYGDLTKIVFDSQAACVEYLTRKLPGCLVQVCEGDGMYAARGMYAAVNWIRRFARNAIYDARIRWQEPPRQSKSGKMLEAEITATCLSEVIRENPSILPRVSGVDYYADPRDQPVGVLNLYAMKVAQPIADDTRVATIRDILFKVWAGSDAATYSWIVSWLRHVVCEPTMPRTAIFLCGEEGTGKSFLASFLCKYVFGDLLAVEFTGVEKLLGRFGTAIAGKRLAVINEMASARADTMANFDKLKALITERTIQIEPKGMAERTIRNNAAFILTSNNDDALKTSSSDRRYTALQTSSVYRGDAVFWRNAAQQINCQEAGCAFVYWLESLDPTKLPDPTYIHKTDFHAEIQADSEKKSIVFIREYIADQPTTSTHWATVKLYQEYCMWCVQSNVRPVEKCTFAKELKAAVGKQSMHLPIEYHEKARGYRRVGERDVDTLQIAAEVYDVPTKPSTETICEMPIETISKDAPAVRSVGKIRVVPGRKKKLCVDYPSTNMPVNNSLDAITDLI